MRKEYRHMMEQAALSDQKKEEIMNMMEHTDTGKRRLPKAGTIALAAALAVGCALSIAAGLPAQVYHFIGGGSVTVDPNTNTAYYDRLDAVPPAEVDGNGPRITIALQKGHTAKIMFCTTKMSDIYLMI